MPAMTTRVFSPTPYQVQTFLNTTAVSSSVPSRETDQNRQTEDTPSSKLSISAKAQALQQKYARRKDELEQKHAAEKQKIEAEYENEKQRLEQEYRRKNSSLGLNIYA